MARKVFQRVHDIRLDEVKVLELYIKSNQRPEHTVTIDLNEVTLQSGHNEYHPESKKIQVWTTVEAGMGDKPETPFSIRVRLVGFFTVDDQKFNVQDLDHWAKNNAPMILYPFVREQVFGLTARCGFQPTILPLMVLPTLAPKRRVSKKKAEA